MSVEPCTTHDLIDQPTRWLTAAQDVVADPALLPRLLDRLLGEHPEKWSATEHSRAAALRSLAGAGEAPGSAGATRSAPVQYDESSDGMVARIGGHVVGAASYAQTPGHELTVEVAPAWRRLGIGTQLLTRAASQAAARGAEEIVLLAPADDEGFVSMVCSAGLRARIKVSGGLLQARIVVTGVRRTGTGAVPREEHAPAER